MRLAEAEGFGWMGPPVVGHDSGVASTAWSEDNARVISAGLDGRLAAWDGSTGSYLGRVAVGPAGVSLSAAFLDGTSRVTAFATDGSIYQWDSDPDWWIDFACAVASRNLTHQEWRDVFGDRVYQASCP